MLQTCQYSLLLVMPGLPSNAPPGAKSSSPTPRLTSSGLAKKAHSLLWLEQTLLVRELLCLTRGPRPSLFEGWAADTRMGSGMLSTNEQGAENCCTQAPAIQAQHSSACPGTR